MSFLIVATLFSGMLGIALQQALGEITITVADTRPGESSTTATTTLGAVASDFAMPTMTYTLTGLDLTSEGGGASETVTFKIAYSQTGGSAAQVNGFGNISVTGGEDNQIDLGETLTATVSLDSTTFAGDISLGLTEVKAGGVNRDAADNTETWNVIHEGGTNSMNGWLHWETTTFPSSSFVRIEVTDGSYDQDALNLQGLKVVVVASRRVQKGTLFTFE